MIQDIGNECLTVGMLLQSPQLFDEYNELICPEKDFSDPGTRLLYQLAWRAYLNHGAVNSTTITMESAGLPAEEKDLYAEMGGYQSYERVLAVAQKTAIQFATVHKKLKTYSLIRELDKKGFQVEKYLDQLLDKSPSQILRAYESLLTNIASSVSGLEDSIDIGKGMSGFYQQLKQSPDMGIPFAFPIFSHLTRGWRRGKFYCSAFHSGVGKSREAAYLLTHSSIIGNTPVVVIVNEQDADEWRLMLLTCVVNSVIAKDYGNLMIDEDDIARGKLTGTADEMVQKAASFIEQNSKIRFMETDVYDFETLKMILKRHKQRGINYAVIDTMKPFRKGTQGMSDWLQFVYTAEQLKRIIGSPKKGGLDMGLWVTVQLTDDSMTNKVLNSTALASGKQIKHNLDVLKMGRLLDYSDKSKIQVRIHQPGNAFNGQVQALDEKKDYLLMVLDKNRGGKDKKYTIVRVDKGKVVFQELGWAVFSGTASEP